MSQPSFILKLNRATKHIEDLQSLGESFFKSNPYEIAFQDDPNTRERSYHLVSARDFPDEMTPIIGDTLHNLRSALDHLARRLVEAAGNAPTVDTCFPIADSLEKYRSAGTRRKVKGMGQGAIDRIESVKPYKGGNDAIWRLHRLNAIDKHRLLVTVGTAHIAHSMTPSEREKIAGVFIQSHPSDPLPNLSRFLKAAEPVRILKAGDVLLAVPESEIEQYMQFHFDVAFNEPGIVQGEPIVEALHKMKQAVTEIVGRFWGLAWP